MPDAPDERTPTPITVVPGLPARRRRRTTRLTATERRQSWPDALVSIVRIVAANAVIAYMAHRGLLPPEWAVAALAIGATPAAVRLLNLSKGPR